jgi:hypothetical protein
MKMVTHFPHGLVLLYMAIHLHYLYNVCYTNQPTEQKYILGDNILNQH